MEIDMGIESGLSDCHVHLSLKSGFTIKQWNMADDNQKTAWISSILEKYKKNNIIYLKDGGDAYGVSLYAKKLADKNGIKYKTPGFAIYKEGSYGDFLGKSIKNMGDFDRLFEQLLSLDIDHLKLIVTGIMDFDNFGYYEKTQFTSSELNYMISRAKKENLKVMVHANGNEAVKMAIDADADTIEHGYLLDKQTLKEFIGSSTTWVPTLAPLGNILKYKPKPMINQLDTVNKIYQLQIENLKFAIENNIEVGLGSDAGAYMVEHPNGIIDEINLMKEAGISHKTIKELMIKQIQKIK